MKSDPHVLKEIPEPSYFELQASLGVTAHMGGLQATKELVAFCHVDKDVSVLDVGCGIGAATCYIAKTYGCSIVGVDISEEMVARSKKRAQKEGVRDKTEFRVGDAQILPFEDATFDVVVSESVIAFVQDKKRAITEYARVVKPQGYVGLNETTWITPPSQELVTYLASITGVDPESPEGWEELLKNSGLDTVVVKLCKTTYVSQFINEARMMGLTEVVRPWGRLLSLYFKDPVYRKAIKEMTKEARNVPKNVFDYFGYGLYVSRK